MTPVPWPVWRTLRADALAESWKLRHAMRQRYPWTDLENWARKLGAGRVRDSSVALGVARVIAERADVDYSTVCRWQRRGWLSVEQADRAAIRLGTHPCFIWEHWFETCALEAS